MSLYTLATDTFTTFADLRRHSEIDKGQLIRTLSLFIAFAIALGAAAHSNRAADGLVNEIPASAGIVTQ